MSDNIKRVKKARKKVDSSINASNAIKNHSDIAKQIKESYTQEESQIVYTKRYAYLANKGVNMNELYEAIQNKIKDSGYTGEVNGYEIYNELCDFIEDKETGTYIFMSKKDDSTVYEYSVTVMEDNFNLNYLTITLNDSTYEIDFNK